MVRHGKPQIEGGDFYRCHLGDEGVRETKALASSGKIAKPDIVFTSPYNRAIDTAKIFSDYFSVRLEVLDCLKEWNLQSLNLKEEYVEQEGIGWSDFGKVVLGNESLNEVRERIMKCVKKIANEFHSSKNIVIVSHGTVIDAFCTAISDRKAKISDIKNSNHLDYAVVDFHGRKFELIKDFIES